MKKGNERELIINGLKEFTETNPARIVNAAICLVDDILTFQKSPQYYNDVAFDILIDLEKDGIVKNLCKPPILMTQENRHQILMMSQWVLIQESEIYDNKNQ